MLISAAGSNDYLVSNLVALKVVAQSGQLSIYQSRRPAATTIISCHNPDTPTLQLYQCDPLHSSTLPSCDDLLKSGQLSDDDRKNGVGCVHVATLDSTSQQATIHNHRNASTTWNIAFNTSSETISIGSGGDVLQNSDEAIVSEEFELAPRKSVSFPFAMFLPSQQAVPRTVYKTELVQKLQMCHRLSQVWEQFQLPTSAFVIQSDNTFVHSEHSLLHYMELCGVRASTVYMYHSDSDGLFDSVGSRCTVLKVSGVDSVDCAPSGGDGGNVNSGNVSSVDTCVKSPIGPVHPVCIEDVMYHITSNTTSLHYVSSLGMNKFLHTIDSASSVVRSGRIEYGVLGFRDLVAVLQAYFTADIDVPLLLHSVRSASDGDSGRSGDVDVAALTKLTRTLSRQLLSVMMVLVSDTQPEAAFERSLLQLNSTLHALFPSSPTVSTSNTTTTQHHTWHTHAILLDTLTQHFGEGGTKFLHHCANQVEGSVVSYVCATNRAREQLRDIINTYVGGCSNATAFVTHIRTIANTLTYTTTQTTHTTQNKPLQPQINIVVAGDVFVMMFVRPVHVPLVQELVYHWQRTAADHTNFLFVRYMIFPVYDGSSSGSGSTSVYDAPSLQSVLSIVEQSIQHIAGVKDIIYVLNGMHAILSFPLPGRMLMDNEKILRNKCREGGVSRDSVVCDSSVVEGQGSGEECNLCKINTYSTITTDTTSISTSTNTYTTYTSTYTPYINTDTCAFTEGVVPSVPYGWSALLRLQAGVVVGASSSVYRGSGGSGGTGDGASSTDAPWDFNTMVGVGYRLLDMITTVRGTSMSSGSGSSGSTIITEASLLNALRTYAQTHPSEVMLDCNQHAFHTTKGNMLVHMLSLQQKHNYVSYTMLPYLRHEYSSPLVNDSIAGVANLLGVVVYDGGKMVSSTTKYSAGYSGISGNAYANHTLDSLLYSYRKYRPALNTILHAYLDDTNEYASLARIINGDIEYADVLIPLLKTDRIPLGTHYLSTTVKPSSGRHECYIEQSMLKTVTAHIFNEMYMQSDTTAAVLSVVGLLHQAVVCECEDLSYAIDEAVYTFIRIGQLAKYVTYSIAKDEYIIASALLENYETMLLALFSSSTSSGSGNSCNGRSDGMSGNSKYSSSHNTIYGTVLHPTSTVFTPHVRHLYSTLAPFYQDQILVSVRFALMGLAQELAVQPALTYTMHSAYKTADYGSIRKGREEWYRQREVLRRSIGRSSSRGDDGNVDERPNVGSVGSVVSTDATVDISGSTIPNTTHSTASTSTTSTTSTNTTTPLPTVHTHYVTYGSDLTEGLQNLLDSAQLAGVAIEVLGLGTHYADYMSKTDAYLNYLLNSTGPHTRSDSSTVHTTTDTSTTSNTTSTTTSDHNSSTTATPVPEDDVVIFMDAYDVLVFPSIVKAASVLAEARSPIVFCAERGVYPEFAGSFFYNRGAAHAYNTTYTSTTHPNTAGEVDLAHTVEGGVSSVESSSYSQKFLNSGCVLGRAGQLRHMLQYAKKYSRTYRDDQLAMVRYHHENPSLVSMDAKNSLFATSFKLATAPQDMLLTYDLRLYQGDANVGLLHCNNHKSGIVYPSMVHNMKTIRHMFYQGEEGQLLLQAIHHYSHHRIAAATALLDHPTVLRNCSSNGGGNPIRVFILNRIQLDKDRGVGGNHNVLV